MSFFGKNIKKIRGFKRMSQQAFADVFDLKRATLGAYEEGRSEPKIDTIIKVANYFSISIDDILTKELTVNELLSFDDEVTTDVNHMVNLSLEEIPFVSNLNSLEFSVVYKKSKSYRFLPKIKVPLSVKGEVRLAYLVQDLVMVKNEEGLYPGDVVYGIESNIEMLKSGDVVIALIDKTFYVRRVEKNPDSIALLADHVNIAPVNLDLESTNNFFWKVEGVVLQRYPNFNSNIDERIALLNHKIEALAKK